MANHPEHSPSADPSDEDLERLLGQLRSGKLSGDQIVHTTVALGRAHYLPAEAAIAPLLHSRDSEVRRYAMMVLARDWKLCKYRGAVERILRHDRDGLTRLYAVFSLAALSRCGDRRSILVPLLRTLSNENEADDIRGAAYGELCALAGPPMSSRVPSRFSEIIDWEPIERIKAEVSSGEPPR